VNGHTASESPTGRAGRGGGAEDSAVVELLACNAAVVAIAAAYYTWKDRLVKAAVRRHVLRQRMAYLLWAVAARG
jgi:uncharacterized iron-regulated membrane protein